MVVRFVTFKSTETSDWKAGVIIQGAFETTLVDEYGRVVKEVFDAQETGIHMNYNPVKND